MRRVLLIACLFLAIGALIWLLRSGPPAQEAVFEPVAERPKETDETAGDDLTQESVERQTSQLPAEPEIEVPVLTVRGRVVDEQSRPMADADVAFREFSWILGSPPRVESLRAVDAPNAPTFQSTRTTEDGRFELVRIPPVVCDRYVFMLGARAQGRVSPFLPGGVLAGGTVDVGDLVLRKAVRLAGFVHDTAGLPCAGARVLCATPGVATLGDTRTASDGSFAISDVPADKVWLAASMDDLRDTSVDLDLFDGLPRLDVELVLPPAKGTDSISGVVLDPEGAPFPDALLRLRSESDSEKALNRFAHAREDGRFRIEDAEGAVIEIVARDLRELRYAPARATGVRGGTHGLELRMTPRAEFVLRVVDGNDQPITRFGYDVSVERLFATSFAVAEHPAGEAHVPLDPAEFGLRVFAPGYGSKTLDSLVPGHFDDPLVVSLARGTFVRGEVRGKDGPLARARVTPAREDYVDSPPLPRTAQAPSPEAISDSEGRFELTIERAGTISLRAVHARGSSAPSAPIEVRPGTDVDGIVLEIDDTGAIRGRVLRHDGRPGANLGARVVDDHGAVVVTTATDREGALIAAGLAPGRYRVRIVNDAGFLRLPKGTRGPRSADFVEWPCEVAAGVTCDVAIRLQPPVGLKIHFDLPELAGGKWSVACELEDPFTGDSLIREEAHPAGVFDRNLELLEPTACAVSVEAEIVGGATLTYRKGRLERGDNSIPLVPGFGRIRGRIASAPADGRTMRLIWAGNEWRGQASIVLGPDGSFEFPCAPAGTCRLSFENQPPRQVDVKAGELTDCGEW